MRINVQSERCLKFKAMQERWQKLEVRKADKKWQLAPASSPCRWYIAQIQHKTGCKPAHFPSFFAMGDMQKQLSGYEKMHVWGMHSFISQYEDHLYRIKHPMSPFRPAGNFEGAVRMKSKDRCPANINNRYLCSNHGASWVLLKPSLVGRCWQLLVRAWMCLEYLLVTVSCAPHIWGKKGDYHPLQTWQHHQGFALIILCQIQPRPLPGI